MCLSVVVCFCLYLSVFVSLSPSLSLSVSSLGCLSIYPSKHACKYVCISLHLSLSISLHLSLSLSISRSLYLSRSLSSPPAAMCQSLEEVKLRVSSGYAHANLDRARLGCHEKSWMITPLRPWNTSRGSCFLPPRHVIGRKRIYNTTVGLRSFHSGALWWIWHHVINPAKSKREM